MHGDKEEKEKNEVRCVLAIIYVYEIKCKKRWLG